MLTWGVNPTCSKISYWMGAMGAVLKHMLGCGGAKGLPVCGIPPVWDVPDQPTSSVIKWKSIMKDGKMEADSPKTARWIPKLRVIFQ